MILLRTSLPVLLLALLARSAFSDHEEYAPVCNVSDYTERLSISLPSEISFSVEANLVQFNTSFTVHEYYDGDNNRGRIVFAGRGRETLLIFDYDDAEVFLIPDRFDGPEVECGVRIIEENSPLLNRTFGFAVVNGSVHIGSVQRIFNLGNDSNARRMGLKQVRGVPCDHWQTCTVLENNSYTLDYYFSSEGKWNSTYRNDPVPVQITLMGSRLNATTDESEDIHHIYTFTNFNSGPDSARDDRFAMPMGLICRNRKPGPPIPEPGNYFSTYIEAVQFNSAQNIREFYDYEHQLFRLDVYFTGQYGGEAGPITIVQDFQQEVEYTIFRLYGNCSVGPINANSSVFFDVSIGDDGLAHLKKPRDLFQLNNNFTYEGVTNVRGADVDVWIMYQDFESGPYSNITDAKYEYYFTRPGFTIANDNAVVTKPIPWRSTVSGKVSYFDLINNTIVTTDFSAVYDIFDFSTNELDFDFFDTQVCIDPANYHIFVFVLTFDGPFNEGQLRKNIRVAMSNYTGSYPLQIGAIDFVGRGSSDLSGSDLVVSLHLASVPAVATVTNAKTADDLLAAILSGMQANGSLPFQVMVGDQMVTPVYFNTTQPSCPAAPSPTPCPTATPSCPAPPSPTPCLSATPSCPTPPSPTPCPSATPSCPAAPSPTPCPSATPSCPTPSSCPPMTAACPTPCPMQGACPTSTPCPSVQGNDSPCSSNFSTATRIGYALGMFVFGVLVGIMLMFLAACIFICCRRMSRKPSAMPVSYEKHTDDMEF